MIERPNYVRVINGNKEKIVGRYDGEDYEFLHGVPADIPLVVAAHVFDFGRRDKTRALNRLGWLNASDQLDKAMEKLNNVKFTEAPPLVEASVPDLEDDPASDLVPASGSTAPPVSPEASGGGRAAATLSLPKPRR